MSLTSTEKLQADTDGGQWKPQSSPFQLQVIPDSRPSSDKALVRLRQMKATARRVTAHEFWDPNNTRYELRLLVTPLRRYSDPEKGLLDGAMFAFVHGTNPEILMFVEARRTTEAIRSGIGALPPSAAPNWWSSTKRKLSGGMTALPVSWAGPPTHIGCSFSPSHPGRQQAMTIQRNDRWHAPTSRCKIGSQSCQTGVNIDHPSWSPGRLASGIWLSSSVKPVF